MSDFDVTKLKAGDAFQIKFSSHAEWHNAHYIGLSLERKIVYEFTNGIVNTLHTPPSAGTVIRMKPKPPITMLMQLYRDKGADKCSDPKARMVPMNGNLFFGDPVDLIGGPQKVLVPEE